jgi:hypothetical protein
LLKKSSEIFEILRCLLENKFFFVEIYFLLHYIIPLKEVVFVKKSKRFENLSKLNTLLLDLVKKNDCNLCLIYSLLKAGNQVSFFFFFRIILL